MTKLSDRCAYTFLDAEDERDQRERQQMRLTGLRRAPMCRLNECGQGDGTCPDSDYCRGDVSMPWWAVVLLVAWGLLLFTWVLGRS